MFGPRTPLRKRDGLSAVTNRQLHFDARRHWGLTARCHVHRVLLSVQDPVQPIGEVSISSQWSSRTIVKGRAGNMVTLAALATEVCWRDARSVTGEVAGPPRRKASLGSHGMSG